MDMNDEETVSLETPPEEEGTKIPLEYDEEAANLVPALKGHDDGKKALKSLAEQVSRHYESAWDSSAEYRDRRAENFKVYAGEIPKRGAPYDNMPSAHLPLLLEGATRLGSRLFAELFPDRANIFAYIPTGPDDLADAEILTTHDNWQVRNDIPDFFRQQHRGIMEFFTAGDVTTESYYDEQRRQNRHEVLTCDDFVTPYLWVATMPDWSDAPYVIKKLRLYRHQVEAQRGVWDDDALDATLDHKASWEDGDDDTPLRSAVGEASGITAPDDDDDAPYLFYQYHGWWKPPGAHRPPPLEGDAAEMFEEGEAVEHTASRYCCVIMDAKTKNIMRVYIDEEEDWKDRVRFDRQTAEMEQYQMGLQQHQQAQAEAAQIEQTLASPEGAAMVMENPQQHAEMTARMGQAKLMPPPQLPQWTQGDPMAQPEMPRKVPAYNRFSHGVCIENPLGNFGLSYGDIIGPMNRLADNNATMFNDSAILANQWSIIAPDTLDIDRLDISPGKVNRVTGMTADDLRKSIIELKPAQANDQLLKMVDMMHGFSQSSISAPEILSGEPGKSGETYRGVATRVEQALKQLSVAAMKYSEYLGQVFRNNCKLNSIFMPEDEVRYITDHLGQNGQNIRVGRRMWERNYKVTVTADLRFVSREQRTQEADALIGLPQAVPPLQGNMAWHQAAVARKLKAMGANEMIPYLGPPLPPPQTPLGLPPPPPPGMAPPGQQPPNGQPRPPAPPGNATPQPH